MNLTFRTSDFIQITQTSFRLLYFSQRTLDYYLIHCIYFYFILLLLLFLVFLGLHLWHMEVPRLGVQSELQLLGYTTATATPDPSRICNLNHSSRQRWILNTLSKARDWTHSLMVPRQIRLYCTMMGTPDSFYFSYSVFSSIFPWLFTLDNFNCSVFQFTDYFLSHFLSNIELVQWLFFWLSYFSVL